MRTTPIDLSQLPAPDIVGSIDFETLYAQRKARLIALYPADQQAAIAAALALESEPMARLLQENAYREMVLRQLVNDSARGILLAYASGSTLDHIAALFDVDRLVIDAGDPGNGVAPTYEDDDSLRERVQLAPRGFSVAGPEEAYEFHARSADGRVLSASAKSPQPCVMVVSVLSRDGDGTAEPDLLDNVRAELEGKRPQADQVIVQSAEIVPYAIRATLRFFSGPDRAVALAEAQKRVAQFASDMHRIGMEVTLDGLYAAMRVPGVQKVLLDSPAAGVAIGTGQAPYCTGIELIDGGVADE
ncbi:baseplate J/gp47 family protein [Burkholderia sp. Ac-20379]|uniref:baseplate J/gp47 family protein n=1 Tax=Burkholderia sp. Ac-20379 TaxID=2703900 RepID=UPI001981A450|nr:baseplate J/gp47 family protein [Burkholderia sp. Ac-20379]MBN3725627.1 baseplate assembly protein [Burkholderia sp. Ac-20379]